MKAIDSFLCLMLMLNQGKAENLALMKHTYQSNTFVNSTSDKAVDGFYEIRGAPADHCTISGGGQTSAFWYVDLGAIKSIHSITIVYRTDGLPWRASPFPGRFLGFMVTVHNHSPFDPFEPFVFFRDLEYNVSTIPRIWTHTNPVQGRYVLYYNARRRGNRPGFSTWAYLELCEVVVEGCSLGFYGYSCSKPCPVNCRHCDFKNGECLGGCRNGYEGHQCKLYTRENMAFHRPTNASFPLFDYAKSGGLVVDGKKYEFSHHGQACLVTQDGKSYSDWHVDLQYVRSIERVKVYSRTDNQPWDNSDFKERLLGFSIIVSNTTHLRDGIVCFRENKHTKASIPAVIDADCHAVGRYVFYYNARVPDFNYPKDYSEYAFADICEVEVYGCPYAGYNGVGCSVPCFATCKERYLENIAVRKPTWMSSTWGGYNSHRAVDGNKQRDYRNGFCTVSPDVENVTWLVNLQEVKDIGYVVIYFRTDDKPFDSSNVLAGFPLGFSLYISNTTNKDDGVLCFYDTKYTRNTIPETLNITCPYKGQYVIYYNERIRGWRYPSDYYSYARADLCEVEVYGCRVPVENHPDCFHPCPLNCQQCHAGTGVCRKCFGGYEGDRCQHEKKAWIEDCQIGL